MFRTLVLGCLLTTGCQSDNALNAIGPDAQRALDTAAPFDTGLYAPDYGSGPDTDSDDDVDEDSVDNETDGS